MQVKAERYHNRIRSILHVHVHYTIHQTNAHVFYTRASLASPTRALYFVEITDFVVRVHSACIVFRVQLRFASVHISAYE